MFELLFKHILVDDEYKIVYFKGGQVRKVLFRN